MAERVGFEPTVRETAHLISNQALSTTQTPLRDDVFYVKANIKSNSDSANQ